MKFLKNLNMAIILLAVITTICFSPCFSMATEQNLVVISAMPVILPDPALAMDWYDLQVLYNLYSPLVYPTPEGTIRPHLAESWEPVDGKLDHWRFKLREGVKFHDGSELTSEDVEFSMNRFIEMKQGFSSILGKVTANAIDDYMIDFTLDKPNAIFPETLTLFFPLNKDLVLENIEDGKYGEFGDYGENWLLTHDAGSGPYVMARHEMGESMDAIRFTEYFLGWEDWEANEEPIERLKFIMETETSTLMMMLKNRQLHLEADGGFSRQVFKEIMESETLNLNQAFPQVITVWMNTKLPPTDDVHFRKAILYAYDYEAILGEYEPFGARETGIYPSTLPGYIKIPPQPRKQNLEKAKEELSLSKYNPADVKVVFHYCGGLEFEQEICLQLQADLSKLGINVEIVGPPWAQYEAECGNAETTPNLTIFRFPLNYISADSFIYFMYHPDNVGGIYAAHWYEDEDLGNLIDQTRETFDFEERHELYQQIQEKIAAQVLAFYPYEIPALFTSQSYLIGPKETFPVVGPTINMHNWRINLKTGK